jgi:hypothetical protein
LRQRRHFADVVVMVSFSYVVWVRCLAFVVCTKILDVAPVAVLLHVYMYSSEKLTAFL